MLLKECQNKVLKNIMSNKQSKYLRNGQILVNDEKKKRSSEITGASQSKAQKSPKKKLKRSRKRRLIGKKKGIFLKNTSVKNIH